MRRSGGAGKKKEADAIDEVEELLKLTEDNLLLKLTVNSHTKSKSKSKFDLAPESSNSNAIDPDLDRRFQALRSKPKPIPKSEITAGDEDDVDNLFARFAALKPPNATSASNSKQDSCGIVDVEDEDEEDDEVQKIIDWAVDAARLDPSPSSEIDDDDDSDSEEDEPAASTVARKKK